MKRKIVCALTALIIAICSSTAIGANDPEEIISLLDNQIENAPNDTERSKYYCFRARNYTKIRDLDKAEQDYLAALDYAYSGWILNEYSYFLYRVGEYERAYRAAARVEQDFPHLKSEAGKIKKKAKSKYQEEYNAAHPPTILLDSKVDPNRVTRHDLIKNRGQKNTYLVAGKKPKPRSTVSSRAAKRT